MLRAHLIRAPTTMLTEPSPAAITLAPLVPSMRQGRLEEKIAQAIAAGAPRSTIRQAVDQLVLHLHARQVPAARAVAIVIDVASRALSTMPAELRALDTPVDRLALVARWASVRYGRDD